MVELSIQVTDLLDSMISFGGHNGFLNGADKEDAIPMLRIIARLPDRPNPGALEEYLLARKDVSRQHKGAARARKWYEEILAGKRHNGIGGRRIRDRPLEWDPASSRWRLPGR
jgi:hypothetical protein